MAGGVSPRGLKASLIALALSSAMASPAHADTLQEALTQAYINNPTLMAARANLRATDAQVEIERADGRPSANANGR